MPKEIDNREEKLAALAKESKDNEFQKLDALEKELGLDEEEEKEEKVEEKEEEALLLRSVEIVSNTSNTPPHTLQK